MLAALLPLQLFAQQASEKIETDEKTTQGSRVRIIVNHDEDGEQKQLDTTFIFSPGIDPASILQEFDLGHIGLDQLEEMHEKHQDMEIIINRWNGMEDGLRELRMEFRDLVPDLQELQRSLRDMQEQMAVYKSTPFEQRAYLGVYYDHTESEHGWAARISSVLPGTAAEKAGLMKGDLILGINGDRFEEGHELRTALKQLAPETEIDLQVFRDAEELSIKATPAARSALKEMVWQNAGQNFNFQWKDGDINPELLRFYADPDNVAKWTQRPFLGVQLGQQTEEGVGIVGVIQGSTAEALALQEGDIITDINDVKVRDYEGLREYLSSLQIGQPISVKFLREGSPMEASGELKGNLPRGSISLREGLQGALGQLDEAIRLEMLRPGSNFPEELSQDLERLRELEDISIFFSEDVPNGSSEIFDAMPSRVVRRVAVFITMDQLSKEELAILNQQADPKISLKNDWSPANVYFSPNPNEGQFVLHFELEEAGPVIVQVFDQQGKLIHTDRLAGDPGTYDLPLNLSSEPKGIYFLALTRNGKSYTKKVVIQ